MRIFFDMDGVLADLLASWLGWINSEFGTNYVHEDVKTYWFIESLNLPPDDKQRAFSCLHQPGFWESIPAFPESIEMVQRLIGEGHDCYIATKPFRSDNCAWEKTLWIEERLPELKDKIVFTGHKWLLDGDILIDDWAVNLRDFDGYKVILDQPYNQEVLGFPAYRAYGYDEVYQIVCKLDTFWHI